MIISGFNPEYAYTNIKYLPWHNFASSFSGEDRMTDFNLELFTDMEEKNTP